MESKLDLSSEIKQDISANELYQILLDWNKKIDNQISLEKINKKKNKRKKFDGSLSSFDLKFSISNFPTPIKGIEMIDIKLKNKFKEDDIYLEENFIQKYLRRGESFIFNISSNEYDYARFGLPKFFDYKKQIIEEKDKKINNCVLGEIEKTSTNIKNLKYYVYLTTKVNGENFQVSYNKKVKAWVIGSKNVSILCRNKEDLEFYKDENNFKNEDIEKKVVSNNDINNKALQQVKNQNQNNNINDSIIPLKEEDENNNINTIKDEKEIEKGNNYNILFRYKFVLEFGKLWFEILDKKISKDNINNFINELGDYTLIGENVGNKGHEHIKIYKEEDIIFYAIINNNKFLSEKCFPLNESFELLKKYGLSFTTFQKSEKFETYDQLIKYINEQYDIIFDKTMEESGEGSVIYLATSEIKEGNEKEIIHGLGKLKTFEYRFLRKIREKCKHLPQRKIRMDSSIQNEKEKKIIENKILSENKKNKQKIDTIIQLTINETEKLVSDIPKSIYYLNSPNLLEWINFAKNVFNYWYMDGYDYNDIFATFINKMKKLFYKSDKIPEINDNLINEVRKEIIK